MNPLSIPFAAFCLLPLAGIGMARAKDVAAPEEALVVPLSRAVAVGDRFKEITTVDYLDISRTRTMDGVSDAVSASRKVYFEADQEVLAITPKGAPKAYRLEMKKFIRTDDSGTKEIFKPGTVVLGTAEGEESSFLVDGKKLRGQEHALCEDLFGMSSKDDTHTMDETYGTHLPRKMGEAWPINTAKAEQWFAAPNDPRRILGVTGESRLVKRLKDQGEDCVQIGTTIAVRYQSFAGLVPGVGAPEVTFLHAMLRTLPVDPKRMEHGYTSLRRTRMVSSQDGMPPGTSREVIVENRYHTLIQRLEANPHPTPLEAKPAAQAAPDDDGDAPEEAMDEAPGDPMQDEPGE
jgi:hypothetical protein